MTAAIRVTREILLTDRNALDRLVWLWHFVVMGNSHFSNSSRAARVKGFGVALKVARIRAGIFQNQLAEKLGVHSTSVSQWERGDRADVPSRDIVETLERVLEANGELLKACGYAPMEEETGEAPNQSAAATSATATSSAAPTILLPVPGILDADDVRALLDLAERIATAKTRVP